jgi:hypothetical protein
MSTFAAPAAAAGFTPAEHLGHLLIIEVTSHEQGIVTAFGTTDAISATIHDVDLGTTAEDTLVFPKVLVSALKGRIGQTVLGTLGQGQAKPGQSAPWVLADATADQAAVTRATAFLDAYKAGQYAAPTAAPVAQQAPAAWAPTPQPATPATPDAMASMLAGLSPDQLAAIAQLAPQQ